MPLRGGLNYYGNTKLPLKLPTTLLKLHSYNNNIIIAYLPTGIPRQKLLFYYYIN